MKRKNKLISLMSIIVIITLGAMIMNVFDKRPFKFEDFKSAEELESFLYKKFPIGSNCDVAYKDLELAGANCRFVNNKTTKLNDLRKYDYIGWCEYSASWLSWPPKEKYKVIVLGNKDKKIIELSVSKFSGIEF